MGWWKSSAGSDIGFEMVDPSFIVMVKPSPGKKLVGNTLGSSYFAYDQSFNAGYVDVKYTRIFCSNPLEKLSDKLYWLYFYRRIDVLSYP